ncbi:Inner membrane protein YbhQ [Lysobacter dokdonensis DS-58]|uniref:Inner membrane protein YbhQ n=1 Tax=Lysobacter dokdonensis DS-58 TaxID=1300345 RepID=A0A0A2WLT7_9GAMM|nr:lysylphosphatidylglycerol synthase domain-containing protein [Lysobacter dokdonensis]KGQ19225.1 Inner membrane protein YbhQ [Lysobacter dokdonensis DS-58]
MKHRRPWVARAKRVAFIAFLCGVTWLLWRAAQSIDWREVVATLRNLEPHTLAIALALTAASFLLYTGYDLAARRYAGHDVPTLRVMWISFIAYTFALNIGAAVGGAGFRLRMYAREGVPLGRITRVIGFCVATNWIGYFLLAGALFASGAIVPPPDFPIHVFGLGSGAGMRVLGVVLLAIAAAYLIACHVTHGRVFHVRGHHFRFPSVRLALLQLAMATTNWTLMGLVVACFLPQVGDATVIAALLLAAVASAIAHIPAGIGVAEAVFIALLGHRVPAPQLIGALLAYRACYYLAPLAAATLAYAALEFRRRPTSTPASVAKQ